MQRLILGLLGAAALSVGGVANAAVTVDGGTTVDVTGPTGNDSTFSLGYSDSGTDSPFTEALVWTNTLAGTYGLTLSTTASSAGASNDVDFTSALLSGGSIVGSIDVLATGLIFNNDINESYGLFGLNLGTGTYTLTIIGNRGTTGSFGGNVSFDAASAVPEPATWGMMLLGFGAVGFAMRRRQRPALAQIA
jgi:hypothetical protein